MNKIFLFSIVACLAQASASDGIIVRDYYSMLKAMPDAPELYSDQMASDPKGCGIIRRETETSCDYEMVDGMEDQPMRGVAPWQQEHYEHWVAQGCPQKKEKTLAAPAMMFGEHPMGGGEETKGDNLEAKQKRQTIDGSSGNGNNFSALQQRAASTAAIREANEEQSLLPGIKFGSPGKSFAGDDISALTDDGTTPETAPHSPSFSSQANDLESRHHQAQNKDPNAERLASIESTRQRELTQAFYIHKALMSSVQGAYLNYLIILYNRQLNNMERLKRQTMISF